MVCSASLADAEGFHEEMESIERGNTEKKVTESRGMDGMAKAFHITPGLAVGITAAIGLAALVLPIYMPSSAPGMPFKIRSLSYITLLFGFYMAWNIGANDVANAMGTSVGSGALSLRQAVLTAAVLEFSGAFMVGSHVSHTMQSGILTAGVFSGKDSLLFCGMLSSLGAAGTWLQVCIPCSQKLCHVIT
jgi:sodium-dependent phosphate transporter